MDHHCPRCTCAATAGTAARRICNACGFEWQAEARTAAPPTSDDSAPPWAGVPLGRLRAFHADPRPLTGSR